MLAGTFGCRLPAWKPATATASSSTTPALSQTQRFEKSAVRFDMLSSMRDTRRTLLRSVANSGRARADGPPLAPAGHRGKHPERALGPSVAKPDGHFPAVSQQDVVPE